MIARISGMVSHKRETWLIVDVGGLGYQVFATPHTLHTTEPGRPLSLFTHLAVKQDALTLYGFAEELELLLFEKLLTLPGIGPKSAMSIIGTATAETLIHAISEQDPEYLVRMAGMGKKNAEKIVRGLEDKIAGLSTKEQTPRFKEESDVVEAIVGLGYSMQEAREAARAVPETVVGIPQRIRAALKLVGRN